MVRVNNIKKFLNKLWLVLMVAGVASAMDIAPFYFENAAGTDAESQEAEWDYLMKYKMFGAGQINFDNTLIRVTDSVGWFGTSHGDLNLLHNGLDTIGGPILIGGNINFHMGPEVFANGPVNVTGNITVDAETDFKSKGNLFHGEQCVKGTVPYYYSNFVAPLGIDPDSVAARNAKLHFGEDAYKDCFDESKGLNVPEVKPNLYIPTLKTEPAVYSTTLRTRVHKIESGALVLEQDKTGTFDLDNLVINNQVVEVYVPWGNTKEYYDIYLDNMNFSNSATLLLNMQPGGRLTRIFLKNGITNFSSFSNIAVQYAEYDDDGNLKKEANGDTTYVRQSNSDYNGTLLFYTGTNITFPSFAGGSTIQGSFISAGKITIADHMILAGQLLADTITINANFDGKNFIFVPFNPTILDFDPTALAEGKFIENNQTVLVPIKLDTLASVDVSFKYCFDIKDSSLTDPNSKIASIQDFNNITPVCGKDTGSVKILADDTIPRGIYNVYINVAIDTLFEGQETLPMKVFSLAGAVLPGNKRQGSFSLPIVDDPTPASLKKIVLDSVPENSPVGTRIDSLIAIRGDKLCTHCKFALVDSTDYVNVSETGLVTVKDSSILDYESITEIKIRVFVIDTLYQKTSDTTVTIPVINVNENPILDDQNFDVDEHKIPGTVVGTLEWGENDSIPVFRQNVFTAVGGDTAYFSITPEGVIKTKKEFDYETEPHTYTIDVMLADKNEPALFVVKTVTITINDVNENPKIITDTIQVKENSDPGTIVDTLDAIDKDNDELTWILEEDPSGCFELSESGVVTTKKCSNLDYEKNKTISIKVKVTDNRGGVDSKIVVVKLIDVPAPDLEITEASNEDSLWKNPEIIYTHTDSLNICWEINKANKDCSDTTLKPGENKICKEVCDVDGFEGCSKDCFIAYYSDVSPIVYIDAGGDANLASNIYTIVEQPAEGDTNVYVKDTVRQITVYVTDKDPIKGDSSYSFTIPVDLTKKISVPQKTYDALSNVAKQTVALDELNPKTTSTPINGTSYLNSYPTTIAGIEVTVSYVTDTKGNVVKQAVVNEKGKVDSIEVITVTYETEIDGQKVKVSYQADATTGEVLNVDGNGGFIATKNSESSSGMFKVSYEYTDKKTGNAVELTYVVDSKGNSVKNPEGDRGYQVSYTYVDKYGNAAKQSMFVVLDQTLPTVEILKPVDNQVAHTNFVNIEWTVNGEKQDSLTVQGLVKGPNIIVRFYKDKAGNIAADTVRVYMKDGKDLDIAVERPVTIVTKDKVEEYYAENAPVKGQTFAVSVKNPTTGDEVETLIGGSFKTKDGSGEKPYAGVSDSKHLGPTLILDVVLPTVSDGKSGTVSGLATMDDLMLSNGRISSAGMGVDTSKLDYEAKKDYKEYTVDEYVSKFCEDGTKIPDDASEFNLYNSKLKINIWVYTTLGNFVSDYSFTQELNDPSYANEAGLTKLYFELKPDKDGYVHAENGKLMATGAYVYKVEASLQNKLRCSIPPFNGGTGKTKGDVTRSREELLKPFGYKRPSNK